MEEPVRCSVCGEIIGVYEPLLVLTEHVARTTSRASEPGLRPRAGVQLLHRDCGSDAVALGRSVSDAAVTQPRQGP
jgi:hypothetical protein